MGELVAERAKDQGHREGGLRPRRLRLPRPVKALAEAAREKGLQF